MKKLFLLPILFITVASLAQTRLTIQSNEKCATVHTSDRDGAFGDDGFWGARFNNGDGTFTVIRSFLQFDLSSIPQGSFVNWGKLNLFIEDSHGTGIFLLRRVTSSWDQETVTWNTQPTTALRGTIRLPIASTDIKNLSVTNLVQNMVDSPASSFGFAIRVDSDASGSATKSIFFQSPGFPYAHLHPKLVLEYTAPGMNPAVTSTSIDLNGASTAMTIYPNPCNKTFNCNIKSASTDNTTLRVIDILGRTVYSQPVNTSSLQMRINLPTSSAGTYFVVLQDNKGATIVSQQLQVN